MIPIFVTSSAILELTLIALWVFSNEKVVDNVKEKKQIIAKVNIL